MPARRTTGHAVAASTAGAKEHDTATAMAKESSAAADFSHPNLSMLHGPPECCWPVAELRELISHEAVLPKQAGRRQQLNLQQQQQKHKQYNTLLGSCIPTLRTT
jgi:hypothetical protein